jgi:hypothetical protein
MNENSGRPAENPAAPVQQALEQSRSFFDHQTDALTTHAADYVSAFGNELRTIGDQLRRSETGGQAASFADRGVSFIDSVADYLREADGQRLIADADRAARRNLPLAAATALFAGLAVSRFLKSSSPGHAG